MTKEFIDLESRLLGAIIGHLAGDAFGVPFEFQRSEDLPEALDWSGWGTHNQPPGTWSDDGALMLCLLASLHERGRFDPVGVGYRFISWLDDGYMAAGSIVFDVGRTTRHAIANLRRGVPPLDAGPKSERDNGNGSLMRVLPLALDDPEEVEMDRQDDIRRCARDLLLAERAKEWLMGARQQASWRSSAHLDADRSSRSSRL